jgi:hypothetical protein
MSEVKPYTEEELAEVTAAIEYEIKTCGSAGGWWDHNQHFISHDRLLATIEAKDARIAKFKEERPRPNAVFDGEGAYANQWEAWDDGYCEGLRLDDHHSARMEQMTTRAEAAERENAELRATIEAYKAEVEGARNAGLEAAADVCARAGAEAHNKYNETIRAGCGVGGEHLYRFDMATALATSIRALKTTPTGGE